MLHASFILARVVFFSSLRKRRLVFSSLLYYNLCLCNPFKERFFNLARGGCPSFAGAKVRTFHDMAKTKSTFFAKKTAFLCSMATPSRARNILWYTRKMPACMKRRQILLTSFFFCNFALEFQLSNKKHEATIDFGSQRVA